MNRQERRRREAAEAKARKQTMNNRREGIDQDFSAYESIYRKAFRKTDEREIGEGYMRGQAANVAGIEQMIIHPPDEAPFEPSSADIRLSVRYRSQRYLARVRRDHLDKVIEEWPRFAKAAAETEEGKHATFDPDPRANARNFIWSMILGNYWQNDGQLAALTAAAIGWLVRTAPSVGLTLGEEHKVAHYEITDLEGPPAQGKPTNWRLVMTRDEASFALPDFPVPKWD